ncbi:hypothetical protein ScPMuIL_005481 [Solemya velum]
MQDVNTLEFLARLRLVHVLLDFSDGQHSCCIELIIQELERGEHNDITPALLAWIVEQYPSKLTDHLLWALSGRTIRALNLKNCKSLSIGAVCKAISRCTHLEEIDIGSCDDLAVPELFSVTASLLHLRAVSFAGNAHMKDETVQTLLRNSKNLCDLNISSCDSLTDQVFLLEEEKQATREIYGFTDGDECSVNLVNVEMTCSNLTATAVRYLVTLCGPSLRSVSLGWTEVTCTALLYLSGYGLPAVVDIILSQSLNFGEKTKKELQESLKELEETRTKYIDKHLFPTFTKDEKDICDIDNQQVTDCTVILPVCDKSSIVCENRCDNHSCCFSSISGCLHSNVCGISPKSDSQNTKDSQQNTNCDSIFVPGIRQSQNCDLSFIKPSDSNYTILEGCVGDGKCCFCEKMQSIICEKREIDIKLRLNCEENVSKTNVAETSSIDGCNETGNSIKNSDHFNLDTKHMNSREDQNVDNDLNMTSELHVFTFNDEGAASSAQKLECCCHCQHCAPADSMNHPSSIDSTSNGIEETSERNINPKPFKTISRIFKPNLISLNIQKIEMVNVLIGSEFLRKFIDANPGLQQLWLEWEELEDEMLDYICSHLPSLRSIRLMDCRSLGSSAVANLGRKCTDLVSVDLQGVCFIGSAAVIIYTENNHLKKLSLAESNITDLFLQRCATRVQEGFQLEDLDLSWCEEISEAGLNIFCSRPSCIKCISFRHLPASDLTLMLIAENFRQLTHLVLSTVSDISDQAVVKLAENIPQLEVIDISWNSELTDVSVTAVLQYCMNLKKAFFGGLKQLTTNPFLPIISDVSKWRLCRSFWRREFRGGRNFNYSATREEDSFIPHRSTSYVAKLQYLGLCYCNLICDEFLEDIVAICRGSLVIDDYYAEMTTDAAIGYGVLDHTVQPTAVTW